MIRRMLARGRQDGQAFMLALFVVLAAFLLVGLIYNTGVLLSHKMALQNAADVAALAGAASQALGFNEIIKKEKEIRAEYLTRQDRAASYFAQLEAISKPAAMAEMAAARTRIERLALDIDGPGGLNDMYSGWSANMARMIAARNYKFLDGNAEVIYPRALERRITELQSRFEVPFYYYYYEPECKWVVLGWLPCFTFDELPGNLRVWHRGKRGPVTQMTVRLRSEPIGPDQLFAGTLIAPDGVPPMEAVASAKPFGGFVVHEHDRNVFDPLTRTVPMPWTLPFIDDQNESRSVVGRVGNIIVAHLAINGTILVGWKRPPQIEAAGWNETVAGFPWNRHDYEAFLVSVGHPKIANEIRYAIPDAHQYLH